MPIEDVCNLPEDERDARAAMIRAEILPLVLHREEVPGGFALEFERTKSIEPLLEQWAALERICCAGLEWKLEAIPAANRVRLSVLGEGARELQGLAGNLGKSCSCC